MKDSRERSLQHSGVLSVERLDLFADQRKTKRVSDEVYFKDGVHYILAALLSRWGARIWKSNNKVADLTFPDMAQIPQRKAEQKDMNS